MFPPIAEASTQCLWMLLQEHKLQVAHELNKQRKCMLQCLRNQPPAATTGVMDEFVQSFHQICLSVTVQSLR